MTAAGFCSRCGERRDCSGCSCSPAELWDGDAGLWIAGEARA